MNGEGAWSWHRTGLCLLVLAAALRVWWALVSASMPFSDFKRYFDVATEFASTGNLASHGFPYVAQPPVYPLFLGALFRCFSPDPLVGKLGNAALAMLALWLFWKVLEGQRLTPPARVLALSIVAFYPPLVAFVSVLGQEMLAVLEIVVILWLMDWRTLGGVFLLGLGCGLLTLTRSQYVLLPFCLLGVGWSRQWYSKRVAALLLFGFTLVISPWVVRNYRVFHAFIPTSANGGYVLLVNNNPANFAGGWMPLSKVALTSEQRERFSTIRAESFLEEGDESAKFVKWTPALDQVALKIAAEDIRRQPLHFIELGFKRIWITYFTGGTSALYWALSSGRQAAPLLNEVTDLAAAVIFVLSLAGVFIVARRREPVFVGAAVLFLLSLLAIFVFEGQGRGALPTIPASAILAGVVADQLRGSIRTRYASNPVAAGAPL